MTKSEAVFFIGFGGPENKEDILPFLERVTRGRGIPPERLKEVAHHYEVIGGKSPINEITQRQADALQKELGDTPVYVGNRNWHPFIEDTLRKMTADGIRHAVGFPTAGFRCEASWERYLAAVESARAKIPNAPEITYTAPWFDHALYIDTVCERIKEAAPSQFASWIFTAHSIPSPMAAASRYVQELEKTAELVCKKVGRTQWKLAYTSRSGAPTDPWLEPDVCDEIRAEAKRGVCEVLAIPIGFVADHVEVLFDLDVEAKEAADTAGIRFKRAKTAGEHPFFIRMIADVISKVLPASTPR